MNCADLAGHLESAGMQTIPLHFADGSSLLVLPHGGRALGLFPPAGGDNFYWTNPALATPGGAKKLFASTVWHNTGGDRTWLAPELDFFLPNFPAQDRYLQPSELDPGSYQASVFEGGLRLVMDLTMTPRRLSLTVPLRITKTFGSTTNPLRDVTGPERVEFAGYEVFSTLQMMEPADTRIGLWQLMQMPHGGELIIATHGMPAPDILFGEIPPGDLQHSPGELRYRMRAVGGQKLGLCPEACRGRVGYLFQQGETTNLVVRNFGVVPDGEYVDTRWDDPDGYGYCVQACCVNNELGAFSELEYHVPGVSPSNPYSKDRSQVWAFRGAERGIADVQEKLFKKPAKFP